MTQNTRCRRAANQMADTADHLFQVATGEGGRFGGDRHWHSCRLPQFLSSSFKGSML
jgi:hypothetical protein